MKIKLVVIAFLLLLIASAASSPVGVRYRSGWTRVPGKGSVTFEHRLGVLPSDLDAWCSTAYTEAVRPCYEDGQVHVWTVTSGAIVVENWAPHPVMVMVAAGR